MLVFPDTLPRPSCVYFVSRFTRNLVVPTRSWDTTRTLPVSYSRSTKFIDAYPKKYESGRSKSQSPSWDWDWDWDWDYIQYWHKLHILIAADHVCIFRWRWRVPYSSISHDIYFQWYWDNHLWVSVAYSGSNPDGIFIVTWDRFSFINPTVGIATSGMILWPILVLICDNKKVHLAA